VLLNDKTAVEELLEILGYLPLAIVQAAAFINNNDISVSGYILLFRHTGTESDLFSERFEDLSRYREMDSTVAKTSHISSDQIQKQDRLAAEYLLFMACIDCIDIPWSLLPPGGLSVQQTKAVSHQRPHSRMFDYIVTRSLDTADPESSGYSNPCI
jgi:hypothetical protein